MKSLSMNDDVGVIIIETLSAPQLRTTAFNQLVGTISQVLVTNTLRVIVLKGSTVSNVILPELYFFNFVHSIRNNQLTSLQKTKDAV